MMAAPAFDSRTVGVEGAEVAYRRWGGAGADGCILVHGIAAHSGWWDDVAAVVSADRAVAAVDLTGHGDSDHRHAYSRDRWARELAAVADAEGWTAPVLVGHSLGGMVALHAAAMFPGRFAGVCAIESNILPEAPPPTEDTAVRLRRPHRVHPSRAEALRRWHTLPPEEVDPVVAARVAEQSLRAVEGGWSWKFDPEVFRAAVMLEDEVVPLEVPTVLYRGALGPIPRERLVAVGRRLGPATRVLTLPGVGHNVMLADAPLVTTMVGTLLAAWSARVPAGTPVTEGALG